MDNASVGGMLRQLRQWLAPRSDHATNDGQLLRQFLEQRDETAFARLVERHGPMVLGVCRDMLNHEQDVEDAFQATFLVLAMRGAAVRRHASVGSWLHGVAYRVALKARKRRSTLRRRELRRPRAFGHGAGLACPGSPSLASAEWSARRQLLPFALASSAASSFTISGLAACLCISTTGLAFSQGRAARRSSRARTTDVDA